MIQNLELRCPHCGVRSIFPRDTRLPVKVKVLCGNCQKDITTEVKRAFMREVALGIAGNLVERENQSFFEYLEAVWETLQDENGSEDETED